MNMPRRMKRAWCWLQEHPFTERPESRPSDPDVIRSYEKHHKPLPEKKDEARARKSIERFQKAYGDKACPVCWYYRSGFLRGYTSDPTPPAHDCPERRCVLETDQKPPAQDTADE